MKLSQTAVFHIGEIMSNYFYNDSDFCKEVPSNKVLSHRLADLCKPHEAFCATENIKYEKIFSIFDPNIMKNLKNVVFKRTYALGDILTCVPVIRQMKKFYGIENIYFEKGFRYEFEKSLFGDIEFIHENKTLDYDIALDSDHVFEQDHQYENDRSYWSRLKILQEFLGLPFDKNLDWSYNKAESIPKIPDNCVCLSLYSTTPQRSMTESIMPKIFDLLFDNGLMPLCMDSNKACGDERCVNLSKKLTVKQAITVLSNCNALITIDTGTLWFNHFAQVPMIGLFGSTRADEKLDYFPKPDKCVGIDMRSYVGCDKFCRGNGDYCMKTAPCLKEFNHEQLLSDLDKALKLLKVGK